MSVADARRNPGPARYEVRKITDRSPHFRLLECWGIWDRRHKDYVRRPTDLQEVRRFYSLPAAEAHLRALETENTAA
ncbi:hypothetical protein [Kitasatospora sp. NPDC094011]|uniref:hypothetical protein n=1 Tax=Kitasatospora sp. NPDC094011 TaxID=3364090 RepID=UPI00382C59CD